MTRLLFALLGGSAVNAARPSFVSISAGTMNHLLPSDTIIAREHSPLIREHPEPSLGQLPIQTRGRFASTRCDHFS